jgi:hypothetical protein
VTLDELRAHLSGTTPAYLRTAAENLGIACNEQSTVDYLVQELLKKLDERAYLTVVLDVEGRDGGLGHQVKLMRSALREFIPSSSLYDRSSTSLLLAGWPLSGTALHTDPTEAQNVAFFLSGLGHKFKHNMPLAYWVFVHPDMAGKVNTWLLRKNKPKLDEAGGKPLTHDEMKELVEFIGDLPHGAAGAFIVPQGPGDVIAVPPGWMHAVTNVQPCVKLAYEFIRINQLITYMTAWNQVNVLHGLNNAESYMNVIAVLMELLDGFNDGTIEDEVDMTGRGS